MCESVSPAERASAWEGGGRGRSQSVAVGHGVDGPIVELMERTDADAVSIALGRHTSLPPSLSPDPDALCYTLLGQMKHE